MRRRGRLPHACLSASAFVCLLLAGPVRAQAPFVPTPPEVVERMLALAQVGPSDYVIDLGSGDGRVLRTAAQRFGARGLGIEHDPELVERSRELARRDGVADKVAFTAQDLFEADISAATVVTMYLLPAMNAKLRARLLAQLAPGTRIVSHDFDMGDWAPDAVEKVHSKEKYGTLEGDSNVYLWIVPADVGGRWAWRLEVGGQTQDYQLSAVQRFQRIEASMRIGGKPWPLRDVRLHGDRLSFTVVGEVKGSTVYQDFDGRASGDSIAGSVRLSGPRLQGIADWAAQRSERAPAGAGAGASSYRPVSAHAGPDALVAGSGGAR